MKLPEQVTRLGVVIAVIVAVVLLLRFVILPASLFPPGRTRWPRSSGRWPSRCTTPAWRPAGSATRRNSRPSTPASTAGSVARIATARPPRTRRTRTRQHPASRASGRTASAAMASIRLRPNGFPQVDPAAAQAGQALRVLPRRARPGAPEDAHGMLGLPWAHRAHQGAVEACAAALRGLPRRRRAAHDRAAFGAAEQARQPRSVRSMPRTGRRRMPRRRRPRSTSPPTAARYVCWECHYAHLPEGRK